METPPVPTVPLPAFAVSRSVLQPAHGCQCCPATAPAEPPLPAHLRRGSQHPYTQVTQLQLFPWLPNNRILGGLLLQFRFIGTSGIPMGTHS